MMIRSMVYDDTEYGIWDMKIRALGRLLDKCMSDHAY